MSTKNPKKPETAVKSESEQPPDFESAIAELESLVQRMEGGELSLEDSLREFERGVQLTRLCQDQLKAAEHRVKLLTADGEEKDFIDGDAE
ncbi:MAG: Exodeoxyribonuclease VII small subunit (EC [uncultured Thiotrichaceae bacterium]|uniref:Exodeoxyribonuclease 7 small subunit n=1 Tax=uncultured Thiotrichaceae bacterium TaxID=298394 RepID=A0A6S6TZ47_9GAMM|nr:MAG: Exodeoxyribonuclease VII small subunit (EC [uncultured Thiotrichaceae bacterium]